MRETERPDGELTEALAIETEDAMAAGSVGYFARLLVQATMPHSKPTTNEFERKNGPITVRMLASSFVGLPYGHYPRLLLAWITTEAVLKRSPDLELGHSLSAFMSELGLMATGGRWGSVARLRDHMQRLFSASISWTYDSGGRWVSCGIHPVETAQLWWDPKEPDQAALWKSTISLNRRFYDEIISRPVPLDMRVLKVLSRERSPLAIDIYAWLTYRMSYLERPIIVPWGLLQLQFGSDYGEAHRFRAKFVERLKLVQQLYPQANIEPSAAGLSLRPSLTHVPPKQLR